MKSLTEPVTGGMMLLSTKQAAKLLGRTPKTLEAWRHHQKGPRFVVDELSGRFLGYRPQTIEDYLKGLECQSTAEGKLKAKAGRTVG